MLHIYKYRLKCIIRDKQMVFWSLLFPIILAVLFNLAFSNLSKSENFKEIRIAVAENDELRGNPQFTEALNSVPDLFDVIYTSKADAEKLLEEDDIRGYIYFDQGPKLVVKRSGINQSILKAFLDDYVQTGSTIERIMEKNPAALQGGLIDSVSERNSYLREISHGKAEPDTAVNYFYALIAMACLYGSFSGLKEVTALQGNLSFQGARVNVTPVNKARMIAASIGAAVTYQLFVITSHILFLVFVIKVDFGNQMFYIALACLVSSVTGVTYGTFISSVNRKSEGVKIGILIGTSMIMSFLSGMMFDKMKYIINSKLPILGYLNPANLITDAFYSLYYYDTHTRFFTNIGLLCGYIAFFGAVTYLSLRRQKYASI